MAPAFCWRCILGDYIWQQLFATVLPRPLGGLLSKRCVLGKKQNKTKQKKKKKRKKCFKVEWWCVQKCCHYEINHIISRRRPSTSPVSPLCCHWKYLLFCFGLSADHMVTPSAGTGVFGGAMMKASRRGEWGSDEGRKEDPRLSFREEGREWGVLSSSINFQMSVAKNSLPPPPARAHTHTHTPPSLTNTRRIARTHIDAPLLTSPCARSHCQLGLQLYLCKSCIMPPPPSILPTPSPYVHLRAHSSPPPHTRS